MFTYPSLFSLVSTILFHRPDLESLVGKIGFTAANVFRPVLLNSPPMFFSSMLFYLYYSNLYNPRLDARVPGVGELMLASFISTVSNLSFDHTFWYSLIDDNL